MRTPGEIKKAHSGLAQFFNEFDAHPSRNPQVPWTITHAEIEHVRVLSRPTSEGYRKRQARMLGIAR